MRQIDLVRLILDRCPRAGRGVIGIDGPDAAGKTTLADALAEVLGDRAVRASIDGFHRPRAQRQALPYEDSFDVARLARSLLEPFRAGAAQALVRAYDHLADAPDPVTTPVPPDAVLVLDGVFLGQVRRLLDVWVFLDVPPELTLARARRRDPDASEQRYRERYLPAQARYRRTVRPDLLVDNADVSAPQLLVEP